MLTKEQCESIVFERFAKAAGLLPGGTFAGRPPPERDILFLPASGAPRAFELVEIIDQSFSSTIGQQLGTKDVCETYLASLPPVQAHAFREQYANADICIAFHPNLSIQRRRNWLPRIFGELRKLPAGFSGDVFEDGGPLAAVLGRITVYRARLNGPLFDVPGVTYVGDPTVDALSGKMTKRYEPQGEMSLLASIDTNPMFPDEVWLTDLDAYLASLDGACQFAHVYVFECGSNSIRREWHRPAR
jgi:hypothetical protein